MKKNIILLLCLLVLLPNCYVTLGEEWTCNSCGSSVSGNFCNVCGEAKLGDEWTCPMCENKNSGSFCSSCGSPKPVQHSKPQIVIDYENADVFEEALNRGEITVGKKVRFTVDSVHPQSAVRFNIWSGKHLNFISKKPVDVKAGDVVVAMITDVNSNLGSWLLSYEILELASSDKAATTNTIDLYALSDRELVELKQAVDVIIEERQLESKDICKGMYKIGRAILPGGYTFTAHGITHEEDEYVWVYLGKFTDEATYKNDGKALDSYCLTNDNESYHMEFEEDQVLVVTTPGGTCTYKAD